MPAPVVQSSENGESIARDQGICSSSSSIATTHLWYLEVLPPRTCHDRKSKHARRKWAVRAGLLRKPLGLRISHRLRTAFPHMPSGVCADTLCTATTVATYDTTDAGATSSTIGAVPHTHRLPLVRCTHQLDLPPTQSLTRCTPELPLCHAHCWNGCDTLTWRGCGFQCSQWQPRTIHATDAT